MIDDLATIGIVSGVLVTILLAEIGGLFFGQYQKSRESLSLLLLIFCFAFCGSSIFYFIRFFVYFDPMLYRLEVFLRFASFSAFVFMYEHQVKGHKIPILTALCGMCMILIMVLPYDLAYNAGFTIYGAALVVFWFFLTVYRKTDGSVKKNLERSIIGAAILGIGIGISADLVVNTYGKFLIIAGLFTELGGMALLGASFYSIRSTDEFRWHEQAQSLFIIFNSLCIYTYSIEQGTTIKEADLHGGGLATVIMVAQSIVKSDEPPEYIDYLNMNFLLKVSEQNFANNKVIVVLIARKNLSILHEKLDRFLNGFIDAFKEELPDWNGNVAVFKEKCDSLINLFQEQHHQEGKA